MSDWSVRPATIDDVPALIELWATSAENDDRPPDTAEVVARLLLRDPAATLVAVSGERVVGSLIVGWDGWRAHLYRLAVAHDVRRTGVARRLLAEAEHRLRAFGATRIDAMVLDPNALGHTVWAASGYHRQDDWRRWVKPLG